VNEPSANICSWIVIGAVSLNSGTLSQVTTALAGCEPEAGKVLNQTAPVWLGLRSIQTGAMRAMLVRNDGK
jgi:hypothetical protein